jgi:hypothetical protein
MRKLPKVMDNITFGDGSARVGCSCRARRTTREGLALANALPPAAPSQSKSQLKTQDCGPLPAQDFCPPDSSRMVACTVRDSSVHKLSKPGGSSCLE